MKGKRVIAGILLAGILAVTLAGCKNTDSTKEETENPVIFHQQCGGYHQPHPAGNGPAHARL